MALNIYPHLPKWLDDETIAFLREEIQNCPNPYTQQEFDELIFTNKVDVNRANAKRAIDILTKYDISF